MSLSDVAVQIMCELGELDYPLSEFSDETDKAVFKVEDEHGKYIVTVTPA